MIPDLKQQLQQLIATPSISSTDSHWDSGNLDVIHLLASWLEDLGFNLDIQLLKGSSNKANLIAVRGDIQQHTEGLVLAGHTDTVPYDKHRWQTDPFKLVEKNNGWYGLGATDMKGFFPVAIEAARQLDLDKLEQPLIFLATADEESTMNGARELLEKNALRARYAVIGEPTDLKPIRMHKGMMMESISVQGMAGHSSNPELGSNALEAMHRVLGELLDFRNEIQQKFRNDAFAVQFPTLNPGCIHGGDNPNRICGECELQFDLRPLPGMDVDALLEEIDQRIKPKAQEKNIVITRSTLLEPVAPFTQDKDAKLVSLVEQVSGHSAGAVAFATEAPFLQQLGMETIVMGPGSINQAHQANEFMSLDQIDPAVNMLKQLITKLCF